MSNIINFYSKYTIKQMEMNKKKTVLKNQVLNCAVFTAMWK